MAFPIGNYSVTLGHNSHANWAGTLAVTAVNPNAATYQHGGQPNPTAVTFTYGTNPNWIAFVDGNVNFQQATLSGSQYNGNVTGLPSAGYGDSGAAAEDTWTASAVPVPK
jgi:hypothetical protein